MNRRNFIAANLATAALSWLPFGRSLAAPPPKATGSRVEIDKYDGHTQEVKITKGWRCWTMVATVEVTNELLAKFTELESLTIRNGMVGIKEQPTIGTLTM